MKQITTMLCCILLGYYSLNAQNPNWTLPGQYLNLDIPQLSDLPQPTGTGTYDGDPALNLHAGYTGPDGALQFFTVDENVYDREGRLVGVMEDASSDVRMGFNERLILPMGNDCRLFLSHHNYSKLYIMMM